MTRRTRRNHTPAFKAQVALESSPKFAVNSVGRFDDDGLSVLSSVAWQLSVRGSFAPMDLAG